MPESPGRDDVAHVLGDVTSRLAAAGVPSPRVDAELLLAHVLEVGRGELTAMAMRGSPVPEASTGPLEALVTRRERREPLQHLLGTQPFRTIELLVGPGVFVPRPETESVAGLAIEAARELDHPLVVDLCTGSGAIALAVAAELPQARVAGVELDPDALAWARRNAAHLGLERVDLRAGDASRADEVVLADLAGAVDVVVANPPYIPPDAEPTEPEVRDHDPALALYGGGDDGLAVPGAVIRAARGLLRPGGLLVMEHADTQGPGTRALARAADGWRDVRTVPDLAGRPRALVARMGAGQ